VALVGFEKADRAFLMRIFACLECPSAPNCKWKIRLAEGVESKLASLKRGRVPIVFWDGDRMPEAWKALLERYALLARPPLLIVVSRLADDRLWAEALNLGAYDVLAKPFDAAEVARSAELACLRWRGNRSELRPSAEAVA
jgi:DNA-binding NtrC family response regulator